MDPNIPTPATEGEQAYAHWASQVQAAANATDPRVSAGMLPAARAPWLPMPAPPAPETPGCKSSPTNGW